MDVISLCIIPGKKAAVFKDILSTLHILVQYYKEHAPKGNYCKIRVFIPPVTFKRFMYAIDWLISLSAFDNVKAQGESNLITLRFSFSNQVFKKKCNFWILKGNRTTTLLRKFQSEMPNTYWTIWCLKLDILRRMYGLMDPFANHKFCFLWWLIFPKVLYANS